MMWDYDEHTDSATLVVGLKNRSRSAWSEFTRRFLDRIRWWCHQVVPDALLDDAVQQTFLTAMRCIDQLEYPERVTGWLRTISIRQSYKVIRGERKRRQTESPFLESDHLIGVDLSTRWDNEEFAAQAYRAMAETIVRRYSKEHWSLYNRRVSDSASFDHLAAEYHVSVETVKRRLNAMTATILMELSCLLSPKHPLTRILLDEVIRAAS